MSQGYSNRSQPPRPQNKQIYKNYYLPRRDWGRQENSYPKKRFHSQGERLPVPPLQGNQKWQGKESLPQPSTKQSRQPDMSVGESDSMKVNIPKTKNEASITEKPHCDIGNEGFQTVHPTAVLTSVEGTKINIDKVEVPKQAETKSKKTCNCKCQSQNNDLKTKKTETGAREVTPVSEVSSQGTSQEELKKEGTSQKDQKE